MSNAIKAHMPGVVYELLVSEGQSVASGDIVAYLESMKMQMPVEAEQAGTVERILVAVGDVMEEDGVIMTLK